MASGPDPQTAALLRQYKTAIQSLSSQIVTLSQQVGSVMTRPRSTQEEIDAIEGRRIEGVLAGEVSFTINDLGQRGQPIIMQVSQDGPFVQTHYPVVSWRPSAPDNATNLGRWRPVNSWPLPTQQDGTDIIDILYEFNDGGAQRLGQNEPRGQLISRPDNIVPLPIPNLWSPNAAISFTPTYTAITFNGTPNVPTQGILHVDLPGYRIVNL
jgi:hypothetical protein